MTFRTVLSLKALVCLVFGPLLLFVPGWLFGVLGAKLEGAGIFAAREYGAALFGTLLIAWLARDTPPSRPWRAILVGFLVYDAIGFVITSLAVLSHLLNPLGWGIAVVYLFFTVAPAYLLLKEGSAVAAAA